jgi:hypothetical protein
MVIKKLIAISVVFALVAGAAFAEINVGGAVFGRVDVIQGTSEKGIHDDKTTTNPGGATYLDDGKEIQAGGAMTRLRLDGSGTSEDGTFGGYFRYEGGNDGSWSGSAFGNAWWQPIDQVKFLIGSQGYDGFFGKDGVARWGFYRDAADVFGNIEGWAYSASFYGGFTKGGILTITPLEALAINIGIPFLDGGRGEEVYKKTNAQVAYTIDGIGDLAITYAGGYEGRDAKTNTPNWKVKATYDHDGDSSTPDKEFDAVDVLGKIPYTTLTSGEKLYLIGTANKGVVPDYASYFDTRNDSKFYAYFNLSAVENLGVQLGVGFTLPSTDLVEKTVLNVPAIEAVPGRTTPIINPNFGADPDSLPPGTDVTSPVLPIQDGVAGQAADPTQGTKTTTQTVKYSPPLAIGLGASYDMGAIGIKVRVQAELAQKITYEYKSTNTNPAYASTESGSYEIKGPFKLRADILPSYAINDSMKVFLSAGLELQAKYSYDTAGWSSVDADGVPTAGATYVKLQDTVESKVGWHIFPYFTKSVGWCQGFYAGFKLEHKAGNDYIESYNRDSGSNLRKDWIANTKAIIDWSIPIGIAFQF